MLDRESLLRHYLALYLVPGIGPKKFSHVLENFADMSEVFTASASVLKQCGFSEADVSAIKKPDWALVDKHMAWLAEENNHIVLFEDPEYPSLLKEIACPPPLLFVKGDSLCLGDVPMAMAGRRNLTVTGAENARDFASCLAK